MTEIGYALLKELAVLGAGRQPVIQPQGSWAYQSGNGKPTTSNQGIATEGARVAWVGCRAALSSGRASHYFRIDGYDVATTYDARVGAGSVYANETSVAAGSAALALAELKTDFEGAAELAGLNPVGAVVSSPYDILTLTLDVPLLQQAVDTGGTGKLYCVGDARAFAYRVWGLPLWRSDPDDEPVWQPIDEGLVRIGTWPAYRSLVCAAGYSRIYVETLGADGLYVPFVGPCASEASATDLSGPLASADQAWAAIESQRLELIDEIGTYGEVDQPANVAGSGAGPGLDIPLPYPGMDYPIHLPPFDLMVRNNGAESVSVYDREVNGSNPDSLLEVPPGSTMTFGPFGNLPHRMTALEPVFGNNIDFDVRFRWR